MGVPDEIEGPVRKRPRLSLRTSHKSDQSKLSQETANVEIVNENTKDTNQSSSALVKTLDSECIDAMADLPLSPDPVVVRVASLHNLGNTCFLNSVLEVLRYTPGFLDGLSGLHDEILAQEIKEDQETSDVGNCEMRLNWQVVKNTHLLYSEMAKKEGQHTKIATADVSSMAVRPSILLDNIRELNPMFEGHFQHDAQELLRCLLCYIEDAEKELLRLKEKEGVNVEKKHAAADIEANFMSDDAEGKVGPTDRGASSSSWGSLKGGECRSRSNYNSKERQRPHSPAQNAPMKNIKHNDERSTNSQSNNSDHALCTRKITEEFETVSQCHASQPRKRPRPSPEPNNRLISSEDNAIESTHSRRLRNRLFYTGTSSNSAMAGRFKKAENKDTKVSLHEPSKVSVISTPVDNLQAGTEPVSEVSFIPNTVAPPQGCNTSSISQATLTTSTAVSSKLSIQSMLSLGKTKRLGMRGHALCESIIRASQSTRGIDNTQACEDDIGCTRGDVNNNSDSYINNNNSSKTACSNRFACFLNEVKPLTNLSEIVERNLEETPDYKGFHGSVIPLSVENNAVPATLSSPSKTTVLLPTKSPFMVEHSNEISMISEVGASVVDSTIDSVTRKYCSSLSQSADSTTEIPPPVPLPSRMNYAGRDSFTESSSEFTGTIPPHPHVLEPDKGISVTVILSPNKQSSPHLPSHLVSTNDEPFYDKLPLLSGDARLSGLPLERDKDYILQPSLSLPDKFYKNGECHQNATAQSLTMPFKISTSLSETIHRSPLSPGSYSSTPAKVNILEEANSPKLFSSFYSRETVNSHRSPGANVRCCANSIQPKLEVKKCDWLGVSPLKSISARRAVLALDRFRRAPLNTNSARRKILYEDSDCNSASSSRDNSCHTQSDLSHDLSHQNDFKQDLYYLLSEANNKNERRHIIEALAAPLTKATESKTKLKNLQTSILNFTRRSPRTSQRRIKFDEHSSRTRRNMKMYCSSPSKESSSCLQPVSVNVENCDWLLKAAGGKPLSAKKAFMDIKNSTRITLKPKKGIPEATNSEKQFGIKNTDLSVTEVRLQTSPTTLIERLFGGTMMHQTKCLECEVARQRQEVFMDISVPVRSLHSGGKDRDGVSDDDSSDDCEKDKSGNLCLSKLIQTFSNVERLIGANKYFCEQCVHYVEAERSCHYLALPAVLTLHLKRFSANSRCFGGVSKLVDKVTIPWDLPCIRYQCLRKCPNTSHKYSLYAIITHSGTSILQGHYRAYVKVQHKANRSIFHNLMKSKVKELGIQHSTARVNTSFSSTEDFTKCQCCSDTVTDGNWQMRNVGTDSGYVDLSKWCQEVSVSGGSSSRVGASVAPDNSTRDVRLDQLVSHLDFDKKSDTGFPAVADETKPELNSGELGSFWLECDDECVKVMDEQEFGEKLEERDGCLIGTPYVLFYHKLLV